uniref:Isopentenyl-diphosphate Delta-isomerase n=1 Tax=Mesocestoides corti TaxID=53468 RepID=A0A5K3FHB6_MESCO
MYLLSISNDLNFFRMTLGGAGTPIRRGVSLISSSAAVDNGNNQDGSESDLLNELYNRLDHLQPIIPDRVSTLLLESAGVRLEAGEGDVRLARLVSLAGQKFLSEILTDTMVHWKLSNSQTTGLLAKPSTSSAPTSSAKDPPSTQTPAEDVKPDISSLAQPKAAPTSKPEKVDKRVTLTVEDLMAALRDRGIHVARPPYYK